MAPLDLAALWGRDPKTLTTAELRAVWEAEQRGGLFPGELPIQVAHDRERCLESPSYLATKILDPWYEKHFERQHYVLLDEVMAPWLMGEDVRLPDGLHDPKQYTGLVILWPRGTLKSTLLRIAAQWVAIWRKLRLGEDARTMLTHQVIEKAIEHSTAIRQVARHNAAWRKVFPEFRGPLQELWDQVKRWRWPCFASYQATEWSFTCYGESSSKEGGHYTERLADDWVTPSSVTTSQQLEGSFRSFCEMDNLRDRTRAWNPWIAAGTHYHFDDTYKRLEQRGGWLVWRVPAHRGSPKAVFDLVALDWRDPKGKLKIEAGLRRLEKTRADDLAFPRMLHWRELYRTARATSPHIYNGQILLNPVPEGEQRFDLEAIEAGWVEEIPGPSELWLYVRVDPAISVKRDADETAILMAGVGWDACRWLLDGWIGREKRPTEIVKRAFSLAVRWQARGYPVKSIGFESVAYQEALAEMARHGVPERQPDYHGESVPMLTKPCAVRSIERSGNMRKHERILELDGPVSRREVRWWRGCPVAEKVVRQFREFPFGRDDALDAMHDMWVATQSPPRPMDGETRELPPELRKILKLRGKSDPAELREAAGGMVKLSSWGG